MIKKDTQNQVNVAPSETATLLAIDDFSLPLKHNVCLYLTKPTIRSEPVLMPQPLESNAPDNSATHFYGTVLHDEGRFRMWYYACHWGRNPDWNNDLQRQVALQTCPLFQGPICYAESDDGIHWTKPDLGQVLFKGSRHNNALALPHTVVSGATVIKDQADPDPTRRYKMIYQFFTQYSDPPLEGFTNDPTCAMAVSADGLHWKVTGTPYPREFIEHAAFYQYRNQYILSSHHMDNQMPGEGGTRRGRQAFARISYDFDHWSEGAVESFTLPEPQDSNERGINGSYDQVHVGIGAASLGNICVGLFGRWHNANFKEGFGEISCDLGLVISNDGLHFREPVKGHLYISSKDSPVTPLPGKNYHTNLCVGNGILNVGEETRIYHSRWRNVGNVSMYDDSNGRDYYAEVALAMFPRNRWGALGLFPKADSGHVWSASVQLPPDMDGFHFSLNAVDTAGMTVDITEENLHLIEAYRNGKCLGGDGLDATVTWKNDIRLLRGQTVRFRVNFNRSGNLEPRLFAINVGME